MARARGSAYLRGMDVDTTIWVGVGVMTLLVVLFTGPAMWSEHMGYPLLERPWAWVKRKLKRRKGPSSEA